MNRSGRAHVREWLITATWMIVSLAVVVGAYTNPRLSRARATAEVDSLTKEATAALRGRYFFEPFVTDERDTVRLPLDRKRWVVVVIGSRGCAACDRLGVKIVTQLERFRPEWEDVEFWTVDMGLNFATGVARSARNVEVRMLKPADPPHFWKRLGTEKVPVLMVVDPSTRVRKVSIGDVPADSGWVAEFDRLLRTPM